MLSSLVLVFREVIEAGLIVGIVLAATRGVAGRARWVAAGVAGGVLGACLVAGFAGRISLLFEGSGQEVFNAIVLLLAVLMLGWHNIWMASHGRALAREMRAVAGAVAAGERPLAALAIVVGIAVLREGSEVVLFLYGVLAGGTSPAAMALGAGLGILAGALLSALLYLGLLAIPAHRLFAVTGGLITLLAAGLAAQAVLFLQQAGLIDGLDRPLWNTSWLLAEDGMVGRLLHTLIGYAARPDGAQLIAYLATIALMGGLMRLVADGRPATAVMRPAHDPGGAPSRQPSP